MEHANVAMPILSTHELARNNHRLEYDEHEGLIRHKPTGRTNKIIQRAGVYFIQLFVPKHVVLDGSLDGPFGR